MADHQNPTNRNQPVMRSLSGFLSVFILIIGACSGGPIQVAEDEVIGEINQSQLTVFNSSDQSIYYAVFDQSILPYILWAPISSEENKILSFHKKSFVVSDILNEDKTTGTIIFYFWVEENSDEAKVKFVTFEVTE